jgi:hypothetical protein
MDTQSRDTEAFLYDSSTRDYFKVHSGAREIEEKSDRAAGIRSPVRHTRQRRLLVERTAVKQWFDDRPTVMSCAAQMRIFTVPRSARAIPRRTVHEKPGDGWDRSETAISATGQVVEAR